MPSLTAKQQRVLDAIRAYHAERGYPPSVRELMHAVNVRSPSVVAYHLDKLEAKGQIVRVRGSARNIRLTDSAAD